MKKLLKTVLKSIVILVIATAVFLFWAHNSGSEIQKQFYSAVNSGDVKQVFALFHPGLKAAVDEPVFEGWMKEVNEKLGVLQGFRTFRFSNSLKYENGVKIVDTSGELIFAKGTAESILQFQDEKLTSFAIKSDQISKDWFKGPTRTDLYRQMGKEFLFNLLSNRPEETFQMIDENFQDEMPLEKIKEISQGLATQAGELESIEFSSEEPVPGPSYALDVIFKVKTKNAFLDGIVHFAFMGMKGRISGFKITNETSTEESIEELTGEGGS